MDYQSILTELFQEEDRARNVSRRLMEIAQRSREGAAAERDSLLTFLRGPMEKHMEYEERVLFPKLAARGLAPEVGVATKQHATLRERTQELGDAKPGADVAQLVFDIARLMLHHTNFEGDYIYPELGEKDWLALLEGTIH